MEIIRTPGVTRDQDSAENKAYAENIITLDARLLQDIISGRWTRQQLYEPTPSLYPDSLPSITIPWNNRTGEYEASFRDQGSIPVYDYQSRLLPIGPPSDMTSTTTPPSMVRPSTSVSEPGIPQKKVEFSISPFAEETIKGFSQRDTPITNLSLTRIEDRASTVPRSTTTVVSTVDSSPQRENLEYEERGQTHDLTTLEVRDMDIMTMEHDVYHGIYPDFQLPLPNRPHISDLCMGNTYSQSKENVWHNKIRHRPNYGTTIYGRRHRCHTDKPLWRNTR